MEQEPNQAAGPINFSVDEAAMRAKVGRNFLYEEIRNRRLAVMRAGRLIRVPSWALEAWIRERTTPAAK